MTPSTVQRPIVQRPGGRSRRGRMTALLAVPVVGVALLGATPSPATPGGAAEPALSPPAAELSAPTASGEPTDTGIPMLEEAIEGADGIEVTLVTGDVVTWSDTGDGQSTYDVEPAPRDHDRPVIFEQAGDQENFYVYPSDAMDYIAAGALDGELFNIPALIAAGLTDEATDGELPVIVTFEGGRTPEELEDDADALPATEDPVALETLKGAGVKIDRGKAGKFWAAIADETADAQVDSFDSDVTQVLLDDVYEIALDESVPQIGAPEAWDAGFTGEGVTVAVIDTGVDATHPDLDGQVIGEADFTGGGSAVDDHGHGTHVASTIAGTGAASGGQYTGVAPEAKILSGKVCDAGGQCRSSAMIAGFEWAAQQGADIVNVSLGGGPTDGTDNVSQVINRLTADFDTLFVISAGNSGGFQTVGSPGSADAALTVGAVDKNDQLAWFSSRGPRVGDFAVKPNLTAPGVDIAAARAAGTSMGTPVDEDYTTASGTSMAAPHVVGAAALLAQAKPDLPAAALKDALASTAVDGGYTWFEQGTGRLDVTGAIDHDVYAPASVDFTDLDETATQEVTYTNHTEADITLELTASITDQFGEAADGFTLAADTITVPAGGEAAMSATVDPQAAGMGIFGGIISATGPDIALRTGVGFGQVDEHKVTVNVRDSQGDLIGTPHAPDRTVYAINDTFEPFTGEATNYDFDTQDGVATRYLPPGTYTFMMVVYEVDPDSDKAFPRNMVRESGLVELEVEIDSDTSLTLDARTAVKTEVSVPREVDVRMHTVTLIRQYPEYVRQHSLTGTFSMGVKGGTLAIDWPVYLTPTPPGELAFIALHDHWTLAEPQELHTLPWWEWLEQARDCSSWETCYSDTPAYIYNLPFINVNGIHDLHRTITNRDLVEVPTRYHSDNADAFIMHELFAVPPPPVYGYFDVSHMFIEPGEVTEYHLADDRLTWVRNAGPVSDRYQAFTQGSSDRFLDSEAGSRRAEERWNEAPLRVGTADLREEFIGKPSMIKRDAHLVRGGEDGNQFLPAFHTMDSSRGHHTPWWGGVSWRMWNTDNGTELEPGGQWGISYDLAPEKATYRLEQTESYPDFYAPLFRTKPSATTTWTFASERSDATVPEGYMCGARMWLVPQEPWEFVCQFQPLIQLEYKLGLDINNRAAAGRGHSFTIVAGHHSQATNRAKVTEMTVQASFDDGKTWTEARVAPRPRDTWETGGTLPAANPYQEFQVTIKHPKLADTNGFVALRVQATDGNGGTIDQVMERAYILK